MTQKEMLFRCEDIDSVAEKLKVLLEGFSVMTFTGPLGAGKTTLVKHILRKMGVIDPVVSPTFSYMARYKNSAEESFYHFDLYRLQNSDEFIAAGFDEYLYQLGSKALIEWPESIMPLLTHDAVHVTLAYDSTDQECRKISWYSV